ncbi:MAG TPA: helix-turn-helix domain-containing protein [Caulobacteraceae bacterium]|nr:helix-turn-helix domain-containing protein [Caulobacteraceae bacterium]
MAPLDSRTSGETYAAPAREDVQPVSLAEAASLGEGLKAAREASMRTLDQLADVTRVRTDYLKALEDQNWGALPSRPFTLGYVRAYARALGLDEEIAAERFKRECPDLTDKLQAPVGSELEDVKKGSPVIVAVIGLVIAGVVAWNVTQRIATAKRAEATDVASTPSTWTQGQPLSVVPISSPLPAPPDQTVPAPYITPGLDPEAQAASLAADVAALPPGPAIAAGSAFNPRGAVYGAPPSASSVILQARKAANIVVRNQDGSVVYLARQLAEGEAWRAPRDAAMVVDVSDPLAFAVYLNGEYHGSLEAKLTPVSRLNSQAAQSAAASARAAAAAAPPPAPVATAQVPRAAVVLTPGPAPANAG